MRWVLRAFGALLVFAVAFVSWILLQEYRPPPVAPVEGACQGDSTPLTWGQEFTLLSWNIQFAGSVKHRFFYDGGETVSVPVEDVEETLGAVAGLINAQKPDLTLLQEVDRDARRTHRIDQLARLAQATGAPCQIAAPYWKAAFVPNPGHEFLGRVHMDLSMMGHAPFSRGERTQLALLDEPWWRKAFNIKRALLTAEVPLEGSAQPLAVANTHLSAFSNGDGTLAKQVAELVQWMSSRPEGQPWVLVGDLNMLPPGDDPARLGASAVEYADAENPSAALIPRFKEAFGDQLDPSVRTFVPWGTQQPDRKIDYIFIGGPLEVVSAEVLAKAAGISDHLPLRVVLRAGPPAEPPAVPAAEPAAEGATEP